MKSSMPITLLSLLLPLLFQTSESTTILVDGVSQWKDPIVHVGDSVIFKHKYDYSLYIFQNQRAFNLCNFTQATLLSKTNSTYTWHPSRPGFFYFTFRNDSVKAPTCQLGAQKLAIRVSAAPEKPSVPPAQAPDAGAVGGSAPGYPWPFRPKQASASASPQPAAASPGMMATVVPDKGGGGVPFINSNPAVPLPTGEVDSATITPLPISSAMAPPRQVVMGHFAVELMSLLWMVLLMV